MMLNEPISRIIPKMAVPTIVAFLINSIYSLADTYFVSSLGTNATAAVSVNASLDQTDLAKYRIKYDVWFRESTLHDSGSVWKYGGYLSLEGLSTPSSSQVLPRMTWRTLLRL